ncbi:MAG TPA: DUF3300 domain-containing protein [Candidatus Angelobacter sp.]|jgi:hypothetical protein
MQQKPPANTTSQTSPGGQDSKLSNDQLDSLVAPIALYPDPLLAQTLVACTYPLEIVQLQQWLEQNKKLKGKELTAAVEKQSWDPSIQAMATFPDLVKQLSENIKWTDELGNAFLAQQNDVMEAVQRMRAKAVEKGALKTTEQQKVETKVVENKTVVVVQPASTEVVYVPSYSPAVVWGAPYYPYPVMAYPAYPAGAALLGFGVGVAMGAAWGGGGWGWNAGWGGNNDININRNNTFVNNSNRAGNRYGGANGSWRHNPQHRGGAPYANRSTANRYGGAARGDAMGQRQTTARQSQRQAGASQRQAGTSSFRGGSGTNAGGQGLNRGAGGGGGERIGNRQVSSGGGSGSRSSSAFSGGGSSRSSAGASSSRGASSMGRGGGGRGGGGRRR